MTPKEKEFKRRIREHPEDGAARAAYVEYLFEANRPNHARRLLEESLELLPEDPSLAIVAAVQATVSGDAAAADAALTVAERGGAPACRIAELRAYVASLENRDDDAVALLREARSLVPADDAATALDIDRQLAETLATLERHEEALAIHDAILAVDPDDLDARCGAGDALLALGRIDRARHHFERAARIAPDEPEPVIGLSDAYFEREDDESAMRVLEEFLADHPRDHSASTALFSLYRELERDVDAAEMGRRVLRLDPDDHEARIELGGVLCRLGRHDEAAECLRRLLAGTAWSFAARLLLVRIALFAGRNDEARRHLDVAFEAKPGDPAVICLEAELAFLEGAFGEAERLATRVVEALDPFEPSAERDPSRRIIAADAFLVAALAAAGRSDVDAALGFAEQCLACEPHFPGLAPVHRTVLEGEGRSGECAVLEAFFEEAAKDSR
jgi:tetratricopeptide (TPR) repeat protein